MFPLQLPAAFEKHSAELVASCGPCAELIPLNPMCILQEGGQRRRDAAQEIAAASLVAAVEIYSSMEAAAQLVLEGWQHSGFRHCGTQVSSFPAPHKTVLLLCAHARCQACCPQICLHALKLALGRAITAQDVA